jgi:hypothetical protein
MYQRTWFFKAGLGISLVCGLLLLSGCGMSGEETTYTVSFSSGEGSGSAPETRTVKAGEVIILPNQGGMTAPEGKTFGGWKTGNETYQAGAGFTVNGNVVLTATWNSGGGNGGNSVYAGFHNYPTGRINPNGLLEIRNLANSSTLLFNGTVEAANYIGTVDPISSIHVKLPEEKYYSIVAVNKENYEERQNHAEQFNTRTYYSNTQPYSVTVSPSNTYGGGTWIFDNNTNFWVEVKKSDLTQNFAVIAPNAKRVSIPIILDASYDYVICFSKELKYNGKIVTLVDFTDPSQSDIAYTSNETKIFTTQINLNTVPTENVKPAVMVKNNSPKSIRIYYSNKQKTNEGVDLVITSGASQLVSGFEINDNTNVINFRAPSWSPLQKNVPVNTVMQASKVYEITIPSNENASEITVTEVEASKYYK